jgi:hypothetical protein
MRWTPDIVISTSLVLALGSGVQAASEFACDRQPPSEQISRYERVHDVTIRGLARGPDAIELELHKVVPAKDGLILWRPEPGSICVSLTAYDRDAHECNVDGIAIRDAAGDFVLTDRSCVIRFSIGADSTEVRALGDGCGKQFCTGNGAIEAGTFVTR